MCFFFSPSISLPSHNLHPLQAARSSEPVTSGEGYDRAKEETKLPSYFVALQTLSLGDKRGLWA